MMKTIRKLSVVLLGLVMMLSLAVPGLALPAEDYAVLNVRYTPNDNVVSEGIVFTVYRIAEATKADDGSYQYKLTEPFNELELGADINEILKGKQINELPDTYVQLRSEVGKYINDMDDAAKDEARKAGVFQQATTDKEAGVAQFKGLSDGLYLVASNYSVWYGYTQYIPVAFLVNIPYVSDGVVNNYLTATVKSATNTYIPSNPRPSDEPEESEEIVDIPPDDVPLDPGIEILPDDVPMTDLPDVDEELPDFEIPEDDVPLASLPQTGLLWWPVPVMTVAGAALVVFGVISKRKEARDA